jgi:hypothetical protein
VQSDFNGQEKPNLMGAPSVIVANTGASIDPNEYVTIEVNFTTPSTSGKYRVYWKLRTEGVIFDIDGGSIWVEIEAYSNE